MFEFMKKMFIGLLSPLTTRSFNESLASISETCIKSVPLNNRPCQARPALSDINSKWNKILNGKWNKICSSAWIVWV